jgi:hypothetical protein
MSRELWTIGYKKMETGKYMTLFQFQEGLFQVLCCRTVLLIVFIYIDAGILNNAAKKSTLFYFGMRC